MDLRPVVTAIACVSALSWGQRALACGACASVGEAPSIVAPIATTTATNTPIQLQWETRAASSEAASHHGGRERITEARLSTTVRGWLRPWLAIEATHNAIARSVAAGVMSYGLLATGDADALVRLAWRRSSQPDALSLALYAGVRLGLAPEVLDEFAIARPVQFQLGTGSSDPVVGAELSSSIGPVSLSASARARYPSMGRYNWQPGASISASFAARYRFDQRVSASASLDPRAALQDRLDGAPVVNTGGIVLGLTPAVRVQLSDAWALTAATTVPLGQWLRGAAQDQWSFALAVQCAPVVRAVVDAPRPAQRPRFLRAAIDALPADRSTNAL
ncbi:MAG: hypothetical protein JNK05_34425 [Myxococcales bacterium]|nr:hypothetical protein [Myxococcales bacterium]